MRHCTRSLPSWRILWCQSQWKVRIISCALAKFDHKCAL